MAAPRCPARSTSAVYQRGLPARFTNAVYQRLQALAITATGHRIALTAVYGATETQGVTLNHWATVRVGLVGLPLSGRLMATSGRCCSAATRGYRRCTPSRPGPA